jgi:uncharacterized membrane protein
MKIKLSTVHRLVITGLVLVVISSIAYFLYVGYDYYSTSLEERYFNPSHDSLKASGVVGHGLGIIGSLFIVIGVFSYMTRKRFRRFQRVGVLKYWLEFHIFLCTLGPVLILFHTTFKFGGIVSVSFWSMVAVVLSGIIGRFIYIQIPRTIEGRAMSLHELDDISIELNKQLRSTISIDESIYEMLDHSNNQQSGKGAGLFGVSVQQRRAIRIIRSEMKVQNLPSDKMKEVLTLFRNQISLKNRIGRLHTMQELFKYWHVAHLPFALVMLVIMIIHVVVSLTFGYKWIF